MQLVRKPCNESNDSSSRESITLKLKPNDKLGQTILTFLSYLLRVRIVGFIFRSFVARKIQPKLDTNVRKEIFHEERCTEVAILVGSANV